MSSLDLGPAELDEMARHLRTLNKSELQVDMITVGEYRLRLKSELVPGQREEQHRVYSIMTIEKKRDSPPGGALR